MWVAFPPARYTTPTEKQRFYRETIERIASLPRVEAVAATMALPPFGAGAEVALELFGSSNLIASKAAVQSVTANYFQTLGIRFTSGIGFPDLAVDEMPRAAVVNETFVNQYFNAEDPLGKQIKLAPARGPSDPAHHAVFEIVAVVDDVKNQGLREPAAAGVSPVGQRWPWPSADDGANNE